MKVRTEPWLALCIVLWGGMRLLGADTLSAATPGSSRDAEVVWSPMATNAWPERLWIYKVVPQEFSEAVISNALALASFTMKDRTATPDHFLRRDKNTLFFGILEGHCKHLAICPGLGYMNYFDPKAEAPTDLQPIFGVPSPEEATRLGLRCLRSLGVDLSQIATKPGSSDLDLHWERGTVSHYDAKAGKEIVQTNGSGVFFLRRVDGLNMAGIGFHGGLFINFGNNSAVSELRVTWRNLRPYQLHDCPRPERIEKWLRESQLPFVSASGRVPPDFVKLTIFKVRFLYEGEDGETPMRFVYPYAVFDAEAVSATKTNLVCFKAPMSSATENWRVVRDF